MTSQTVKQARKCAIWPLLSAKRRHRKAPLRGAQGVLAHGMRRKDGEPERIMWRIVLARARGCRAGGRACQMHTRNAAAMRGAAGAEEVVAEEATR